MATDAALRYVVEVQDRDLKGLKKNVDETNKALGADVQGATKKGSSGLQKFGTAAKWASGVALAGLAIGAKVAWGEVSEGQQVMAQTEAVLKSTGGAAGVTAKDVEGLAGSLSRMTGVDDEAIQAGENLLLTFTKVRNEAGKGNDIFNQATRTMLDMSVALGQDTKASAIQLGKALNDPIKGVTALQRVGVSFTAAQKEQIKALVESGDTLGAQKLILQELNTEFGGSAKAAGETLPGQLNKAKVAFSNLAGDLLTVLIPAISGVAGALSGATGWLSENQTAAKILVAVVAGLAVGYWAVTAAIKVYRAATVIATAAQWLLNAALAANPIGIVIVALAALAAAVVIAWKKSETFREIVTGTWEAIQDVVEDVVGWFTGKAWPAISGFMDDVEGAFRGALAWVERHWPEIATIISGPFAPLVALATNAFGVRSALAGALTAIKDWADEKIDQVVGFFRDLPGRASGAFFERWGDARERLRGALDTVREIADNKIDAAVGFFRSLPGRAAGAFFETWVDARERLRGALDTVREIADNKIDAAVGFFRSLPGRAGGAFFEAWPDARERIRDALDRVREIAGNKVDAAVEFFRDLPGRAGNAIRAGAGKLKDAVVDLFGALPGWAKKILGIASPSKVFEEIGENVVAGFIKGLKGMGPALLDKALGMAKDLAGAFQGGGGGAVLKFLMNFAADQGWTVTSGFRAGDKGFHGQGRAIDIDEGGIADNLRVFKTIEEAFGSRLKELFFTPARYSWDNGRKVGWTVADHDDHVHWALAEGGIVPGALLGDTGAAGRRREAVVPLDSERGRRALAEALAAALEQVLPGASGPAMYVAEQHLHNGVDAELVGSAIARRLALSR